jgi:hypothetical protein
MTAVAWAILIYTISAFHNEKMPKGAVRLCSIAFWVIVLLTVRDFIR